MIYGYARISTVKQIDGNSIEDQVEQLKKAGCETIIEEQYSAKTTDRPRLDKLIAIMQDGDIMIVTKLDRLARSVREGSQLIQQLIDKGIVVNVLNMGTISSKPMDKLMVNILLVFAEFERNMIIERTQAGKEIARTKAGYKEGRPKKYTEYQLKNAMNLLDDGNSYTHVAEMTGLSVSTLARERRIYSK